MLTSSNNISPGELFLLPHLIDARPGAKADVLGKAVKVYCCPTVATRPRRRYRASILQYFLKWQDPDSNRGHHDFQFGCLSSAAYRCVRTTGLGKAFPSHRILTTIRHVPGLIAQVGVSVGVKRAICLMWCLQRLSMQLTFYLDHQPRG